MDEKVIEKLYYNCTINKENLLYNGQLINAKCHEFPPKRRNLNCLINQPNMILIPLYLFSKVFFTGVSIRTITVFIHGLHRLIKKLNYALTLINSILLYGRYLFKKKRGSDIVRGGLDLLVMRRRADQVSLWGEE